MTTILEALAKAGLVKPEEKNKCEERALYLDAVKEIPSNRDDRRRRFMAGFRAVYQSALRNPSVSGSLPQDIRLREAAGSDAGKKYKLSGPATAFGMPGRSTKVRR